MTPTISPLRLASYNIRAGLGTDLRRDPSRVLRAINALKPDVITLQEADFRMGARPTALPLPEITRLTGLCPVPVAQNTVSLGWHGIAMLARPDLVPPEVHRLTLPGLEPRGAIIVDFVDIRIVGVHLGLLRTARRMQLDYIRDQISALPTLPTVILGDFNEWSRVRGLGRLARDFKIVTPGATFPSSRPIVALDRIAHSPELIVRPLEIPQSYVRRHPSDHLPILAEVTRHSVDEPAEHPPQSRCK